MMMGATSGLTGFTKPSVGCLTATLLVLFLVGFLVGIAVLAWFFVGKDVL